MEVSICLSQRLAFAFHPQTLKRLAIQKLKPPSHILGKEIHFRKIRYQNQKRLYLQFPPESTRQNPSMHRPTTLS